MRSFSVDGQEVAVAHVGERFYAFVNECTHMQQYLTDGWLEGDRVICAYHEATYELATGEVVYGPAFDDLPVFPVRATDDDLEIEWARELAPEDVYPVNHDDEDERLQRQIMM